MNELDRARHQQSAEAWRLAGPALDDLRREDLRSSGAGGIAAVIPSVDLMEQLGVGLSAETGLVEQQAWFAKLRNRRALP